MCYIPAIMKMSLTWSIAALALFVAACQQPAAQPSKDAQDTPASPVEASDPAAAAVPAKADEVMDDCPGEQQDHAACGSIERASDDEGHFGQAFTLTEREELKAAATRLSDRGGGEKVLVMGTVDSVCKKKGCWMVIKDGEVTARVFTHAGKFFMPVGTNKGRKVVVEGELTAKTMSERFAKHLAEDKGEDPSEVTGPVKEWVIQATGAELL
ncbi:MAG TPA: DUF4920 domain-containing protein [Polyangiaceae bacterium]|nr:DUF4920 domain-containing protein [Polyangiaceae bacterium]